MYGKLDGLPPMLVHYGRAELLRGQIERFVDRAEAAGCTVTAVEHPRLWHSGHLLAGMLRDASDAMHDVGVFLRPRLAPAGTGPGLDRRPSRT